MKTFESNMENKKHRICNGSGNQVNDWVLIWRLSRTVVLNLGFANSQLPGFTGRFPGILRWRLSFHVLLLF